MEESVQRFACTQCGKCCNRSPEVELSEAAALADVFVFRLMFRLYWLADRESDHCAAAERAAVSSAAFFQRKRLLSTFAARKYPVKLWRDGKRVAYTKYLVISALAVDAADSACSALRGTQCGIYDRRPLSCRTVPFHYSRIEALAAPDLAAFAGTSGYECDTSDTAPMVLNAGRIVALEIAGARIEATTVARRDHPWSAAIARRITAGGSAGASLPTMQQVEADSARAAVTTSMLPAWQIAAADGLIAADECRRLVALQLETIHRELGSGRCSRDARETLSSMEGEYRHYLNGGHAIATNG